MNMKRTKPEGCYEGSENSFQRSAINLVRMIAVTAGCDRDAVIHIPSGAVLAGDAKARGRQAGLLKSQGWVNGFPDVLVFAPSVIQDTDVGFFGQFYAGLAIELKCWPNNVSDAQVNIHRVLQDAGWKVEVCYGIDEVDRITRQYFDKH